MNRFEELEKRVITWADDKKILEKGTPLPQAEKTLEEVYELIEAVTAQKEGLLSFTNSKRKKVDTKEEIKDAIGDVLVTLIIQANMQGLDILDCLESALNIIEKRTGKMINGQFVKN